MKGLKSAIADYFDGAIINQTENRAVLHYCAKESQTIKWMELM
jgi:glucose-6-phosphate isomerase